MMTWAEATLKAWSLSDDCWITDLAEAAGGVNITTEAEEAEGYGLHVFPDHSVLLSTSDGDDATYASMDEFHAEAAEEAAAWEEALTEEFF